MRLKKPYKECRFCGQVPLQLFVYKGTFVDNQGRMFRHYRCGLCDSTIYNERVTEREKMMGKIEP
jgi:hypothetical protein